MTASILAAFISAASTTGVSLPLLLSLCYTETRLNPRAINLDDGAPGRHSVGICQVSTRTAATLGCPDCDLYSPIVNAALAARYLLTARKLTRSWDHAIVAYNVGPWHPRLGRLVYTSRYLHKVRACLITSCFGNPQ